MFSSLCGVQFNERNRAEYFMLMLGLNEAMDWLALADSVRWS